MPLTQAELFRVIRSLERAADRAHRAGHRIAAATAADRAIELRTLAAGV